ncbi:MAG: hypothetical protein H0X37_25875 [Herpetosiphonaceae bacterium]|nr:hypothetical protein [Herpetosiphonaceae bacterium]
MNMLFQTMQGTHNTTLYTYHSRSVIYDTFYRFIVHIPWLYVWARVHTRMLMKIFGWIVVLPDYRASIEVVKRIQPDLIICAHPLQPLIFLKVRKALRANYDVAMCICDYGDQKEYVDSSPMLRTYLVRDEYTKDCMEKYIPSNSMVVFGTNVPDSFVEVSAMNEVRSTALFKEFCQQLAKPLVWNPVRKKLLVLGGSGWVKSSMSLIGRLSRCGEFDVLVACGKDGKTERKLMNMDNIFPFGFVDQRKLAVVEKAVDAIILSSIAPATMHELFTINRHPLFVHRYIQGQETPHVKLVQDWNVGMYEPTDEKMIELIKDYCGHPDKYAEMVNRAHSIQMNNVDRARNNPSIPARIRAERPAQQLYSSDDPLKIPSPW